MFKILIIEFERYIIYQWINPKNLSQLNEEYFKKNYRHQPGYEWAKIYQNKEI